MLNSNEVNLVRRSLNLTADEKVYELKPAGKQFSGYWPSLINLSIECIHAKTEEGVFVLESNGDSKICGLYLIANPDHLIELEFLDFDVSCAKKGLLSVIDGWEHNGQFFPGIDDHPLPRHARYQEFCGHVKPRKVFRMSQNAGLIEYRIPARGQGFAVRVRFVENPKRK